MFLLGLVTKDQLLYLRTETLANSISELQVEARNKIKQNPHAKGCAYRIWKMVKNNAGYWVNDGTAIKQGVIEG